MGNNNALLQELNQIQQDQINQQLKPVVAQVGDKKVMVRKPTMVSLTYASGLIGAVAGTVAVATQTESLVGALVGGALGGAVGGLTGYELSVVETDSLKVNAINCGVAAFSGMSTAVICGYTAAGISKAFTSPSD